MDHGAYYNMRKSQLLHASTNYPWKYNYIIAPWNYLLTPSVLKVWVHVRSMILYVPVGRNLYEQLFVVR